MDSTKTIKVVAMVLNSVMHDARVLKQAETLAENGYDVTVVGLKDNKNNFDLKVLGPSLKVKLVPWKHEMHSEAANAMLVLMFVLLISALFLSIGSFLFFVDFSIEKLIEKITLLGTISALISVLIFGCSVYLIRRFFYGNYLRQKRFSVNYGVIENVSTAGGSRIFSFIPEKIKQKKVTSSILGEKPDILHCHDVHGIEIAAKVKKKCGCKVVFDAHEIYEEVAQGSLSQKKHNYGLQCIAERVSDGFITINDSIADYYSDRHPGLPNPVIIKNAVKYRELASYDGRLHEAAGLDATKKILLYQGGFAHKRGLFDLLKVAKYLPEDWSLVLMGWGSIKNQLLDETKQQKAEFLSEVRDVREKNISINQKKADLISESLNVIKEQAKIRSVNSFSHEPIIVVDAEPDQGDNMEAIGQQQSDTLSFDNFLDKDKTNEILRTITTHVNGLSQLENAARDNEVVFDKIVFVDKVEQSELPYWTSGATIGVIPYENIGLNHYLCTPNKLWEYPVAGVPLLISPFPEMIKVVQENDIGWLLPEPINPKEVANVIASLSSEEIQQKATKCRDFIRNDNWEKYGNRLVQLYRTLY